MEVRNPLAEIDSQFDNRLSVCLNNRNTNTDVKLAARLGKDYEYYGIILTYKN